MTNLNILYTLWLDNRRRSHSPKNPSKRRKKILQQFILSLYTLYSTGGILPCIHVYIAKDNYFIENIKKLHDVGLIHKISLVEYINIPWCTKVACFIKAFEELDHCLYMDVDVKIIKELPVEKFYNESLKFTSFGPRDGNINVPRLSSSMFNRSKDLRNYIHKCLKAKNYIGQVCSGWVFFNKNGATHFDFCEYSSYLNECLNILKKNQPIRPFIQDQIIFSSSLLKMGYDNKLIEFMFSPALFYKARRSDYFVHWSDLSRNHKKYQYSWIDAYNWLRSSCPYFKL